MGAGGVHDTYSGPRWVQLLPPPPTSGQCGPSRLFYPRRCHGSAASFSPTAGVEPPAFSPPHPPPFSLSTALLSPLSLSRSEALSAHFALHLLTAAPTAPGGWGGSVTEIQKEIPKQNGTPGGTQAWGWGQQCGHPQPRGGCRGGGGSAGGEHADHHHPPVAAGPDCLWAALPGAAGTPPRRSRFPVHPLVPRMLPPASPRCPQCSLPVL